MLKSLGEKFNKFGLDGFNELRHCVNSVETSAVNIESAHVVAPDGTVGSKAVPNFFNEHVMLAGLVGENYQLLGVNAVAVALHRIIEIQEQFIRVNETLKLAIFIGSAEVDRKGREVFFNSLHSSVSLKANCYCYHQFPT